MSWLCTGRVVKCKCRSCSSISNAAGNIEKYVRYVLFLLSFSSFLTGWLFHSFNIMLLGIVLLYIQGLLYCCEKIHGRIYLLMFYITLYVFLLSRPTIAWMKNEAWWKKGSVSGMQFALISLFLTLVFLQTGAVLVEMHKEKKEQEKSRYKEVFNRNLQIVSGIIFYISMFFNFLVELEKLLYMRGKSYTEYYVSFHSQIPWIVHLLASFMVYSLCVLLATLPKKKHTIIPLGVYFLLAIPDLMIGIRNPIMLRAIFILLYFFMRDVLGSKEKWIGKVEKVILSIMIPCALVFMAIYRDFQSGRSVAGIRVVNLLVKFFYGQGVTFNVLAIGYESIPYLPDRTIRNYTFGGILDSILHGRIAQKIFGATALESGNNLDNALLSNRFAHNMSYVAKGEKYLEGQGWGSSYLLETYTDYGYIGIIIFSLILGAFLIYGVRVWKKRAFSRIILLLILTQIFFMPRSGATECIEFLVAPSFWLFVLVCYLGAGLCCKSYESRRGEKGCLNILD